VRVARCPGCGRHLSEEAVRCPLCGLDLSGEPVPLEAGSGAEVSVVARRPLSVLLVLAGAAVMAVAVGLSRSPAAPVENAAGPPAPPPVVGPGVDSGEPGRVWPPAGPYEGGQNNAAVWTGSDLVLWRGAEVGRNLDGSIYRPATKRWQQVAPGPLPSRVASAVVWSGREVLVWGGLGAGGAPVGDGAAYDPALDRWRAMSPAPLDARVPLVAAWTGSEFLVAGARSGGKLTEAAAWNPETDRWRALPPLPVALTDAIVAWTGAELVVFGGVTSPGHPGAASARLRGASYEPVSDRWRTLSASPLPPPVFSGVWTGKQLLVWNQALRSASYDPRADRWGRVDTVRSGVASPPEPLSGD
jgi:hypothetical protein